MPHRRGLHHLHRRLPGGVQGGLHDVHELGLLPLEDLVVAVVDQLFHHRVAADELGALGEELRVHVLVRCTVDVVHEVEDDILLGGEKESEALRDVPHNLRHGVVALRRNQLGDDIPPVHVPVPSHTPHVDDLLLCHVDLDLAEPEESLQLDLQPQELGASIDLHPKSRDLRHVLQEPDVLLRGLKPLVGSQVELRRPAVLIREGLHLRAHIHPLDLRHQKALHHVLDRLGKHHPSVTDGVQHHGGVVGGNVRVQGFDDPLVGLLRLRDLGEDGADGLAVHLLRAVLHVDLELLEPNLVVVAPAALLLLLQLLLILLRQRLPHLLDLTGLVLPLPPERQCHAELGQGLRQVAIPIQPGIHVGRCQVLVVLVELVAHQDGTSTGGVYFLALAQNGVSRGVSGFFDADHDILRILHVSLVQLLNIIPKLPGPVVSPVAPESREVNNPHVSAVGRLQTDTDRHRSHRPAQALVGLTDDAHHFRGGMFGPHVCGGVPNLPH
mmetsp:Transcript_25378/g.65226  ORF Transcript_25378/g.65226 Transcript_25378/m.65226 type:complete len:497 (+) Transcript_25378:590-2080(+)